MAISSYDERRDPRSDLCGPRAIAVRRPHGRAAGLVMHRTEGEARRAPRPELICFAARFSRENLG